MRKREWKNGESRSFRSTGRVAAAGMAGCLLVGLAVMCLPMSVSASERITRENFDYVRYADDYQDLKEAFGYDAKSLYNHYLNNGRAEGRIAYRTDGSAVEGAAGTASAGGTEQTAEVSAAEFDYVRYANDYQDLKKAFGYDAKSLYNHYLNNGKAEGRIAYRNDGSVIGDPAGAANAGGTEQAAASDTKSSNKIVTDDGWEWHEKWGMWVR